MSDRTTEEVTNSALAVSSVALSLDICLFSVLVWQLTTHWSNGTLGFVKKATYALLFLTIVFDVPETIQCLVYPINDDFTPSWLYNSTSDRIGECTSPHFSRGPYVCHMISYTTLACATVAILCMWASTLTAISRPRFIGAATNQPSDPTGSLSCGAPLGCHFLRENIYPFWPSWCFAIIAVLHTTINVAVMVATMNASPEHPLLESAAYEAALVGLSATGMLTALGFLVHGLRLHYHISKSLNVASTKHQARRILRHLHFATGAIFLVLLLRVFMIFNLYFFTGGESGWLSRIPYFVWILLSQWIPYAVNIGCILFLLRRRGKGSNSSGCKEHDSTDKRRGRVDPANREGEGSHGSMSMFSNDSSYTTHTRGSCANSEAADRERVGTDRQATTTAAAAPVAGVEVDVGAMKGCLDEAKHAGAVGSGNGSGSASVGLSLNATSTASLSLSTCYSASMSTSRASSFCTVALSSQSPSLDSADSTESDSGTHISARICMAARSSSSPNSRDASFSYHDHEMPADVEHVEGARERGRPHARKTRSFSPGCVSARLPPGAGTGTGTGTGTVANQAQAGRHGRWQSTLQSISSTAQQRLSFAAWVDEEQVGIFDALNVQDQRLHQQQQQRRRYHTHACADLHTSSHSTGLLEADVHNHNHNMRAVEGGSLHVYAREGGRSTPTVGEIATL